MEKVRERRASMENQEVQIRQLGEALARLYDFVPSSKAELNRWYDDAQKLKDVNIKGLNNEVPHLLWHYLSDADIRMKDEKYAEIQNERIKIFLQHLQRGVMPSDREI